MARNPHNRNEYTARAYDPSNGADDDGVMPAIGDDDVQADDVHANWTVPAYEYGKLASSLSYNQRATINHIMLQMFALLHSTPDDLGYNPMLVAVYTELRCASMHIDAAYNALIHLVALNGESTSNI
jgi:hypothetical protein